MPIAISLATDNQSAGSVSDLWDDFAIHEYTPSQRMLGYHPHVTLAIYQGDCVSGTEANAAVRSVAVGKKAICCSFDRIAIFEGYPPIFWLKPAPNIALSRLHAEIHSTIDPALCHRYYHPGTWSPHVTVASDIRADAEKEARLLAERYSRRINVEFNRLDCIAFEPVRITQTSRLERRS